MNPSQALQQDYRLYYHGTWMKHESLGIGVIVVDGTTLYMYPYETGHQEDNPVLVEAQDLSCWWPRAGAYNTEQGAAYISRRSHRSMRKSATPIEHYVVKYGPMHNDAGMMCTLRKGPERIALEDAIKLLRNTTRAAVAVTRDIILTKGSFETIGVVFRGLNCGEYRDGEFIPNFQGSPLAKRVMYKLAREEDK